METRKRSNEDKLGWGKCDTYAIYEGACAQVPCLDTGCRTQQPSTPLHPNRLLSTGNTRCNFPVFKTPLDLYHILPLDYIKLPKLQNKFEGEASPSKILIWGC